MASGPSMSAEIADMVCGLPAIVTNSTFRLAPWAWMLYAADAAWWNHPSNKDAQDFAGLKVSVERAHGVHWIKHAGRIGYSDDPTCIHSVGNSGAQAIQIAMKSGAKKVILCGFDMQGCHWHGPHPEGLRGTSRGGYERWLAMFDQVAPLFKAKADIVNCTPDSALKCFRMGVLEDELACA